MGAWLQILASVNRNSSNPLVTVEDIVTQHWAKYGRNYYIRWDFEGMDKAGATQMVAKMSADDFTYTDPVDNSVSKNQGVRFLMTDGSRIIFRLSGTAGSGATVRMYIEQYEPDKSKLSLVVSEALNDLVEVALTLCNIKKS